MNDVGTQIKNGQSQQALRHQVQHIQNAPGASVAVPKRVNGFKLVMDERHLDEWIEIGRLVVVDKLFETGQFVSYDRFSFRRRVDPPIGGGIHQFRTCVGSDACIGLPKLLHDANQRIGSDNTPFFKLVEALVQGFPVPKHFLGSVRYTPVFTRNHGPVQFVLGRDDVLDRRTILTFLQNNRVDKQIRVGQYLTVAF